jgi:hypothetical protein
MQNCDSGPEQAPSLWSRRSPVRARSATLLECPAMGKPRLGWRRAGCSHGLEASSVGPLSSSSSLGRRITSQLTNPEIPPIPAKGAIEVASEPAILLSPNRTRKVSTPTPRRANASMTIPKASGPRLRMPPTRASFSSARIGRAGGFKSASNPPRRVKRPLRYTRLVCRARRGPRRLSRAGPD